MHRTLVSGVVGIMVILAACTASPTPPSTTVRVTTDQPPASTVDPSKVASLDRDEPRIDLEITSEDEEPPAGTAGEVTDETLGSAPGTSSVAEGSPSGEPTEADTTSLSVPETDPAPTHADLSDLIDEVDDLLIDLEAILGDFDADIASVADGLSMNEGDI